MPAFTTRLMVIDHDCPVVLRERAHLFEGHTLPCATQSQPQSLRFDAVVGVEKDKIAVFELRFDSFEPVSSLQRAEFERPAARKRATCEHCIWKKSSVFKGAHVPRLLLFD